MARDYKNTKRSGGSSSSKGSFALGLALGLAVAAGVYFYDHRIGAQQQKTAGNETEAATKGEQRTPASQSDESQTKFDFYDALPKAEVVVPKNKKDGAGTDSHVENLGANVCIQAGAYGTFAEADRVRALLALQGVESKVSETVIGTDTWHRVRIGPMRNSKQVDEARRKLREAQLPERVIPVCD